MPVVWFTLTRSCQVVKRQAYLVDQAMGKSSLLPLKIDLAFLHLRAYRMVFFPCSNNNFIFQLMD